MGFFAVYYLDLGLASYRAGENDGAGAHEQVSVPIRDGMPCDGIEIRPMVSVVCVLA